MLKNDHRRTALFIAVLAIATTACGDGVRGKLGGTVTPNIIAGSQDSTTLMRTRMLGSIDLLGSVAEGLLPFPGMLAPANISGTGISGLQSLQYFIQSIELCQEMTFQGSGYDSKSGCITLYEYEGSSPDYDSFLVTQAQSNTSDGWIDLMTAAGQEKLQKPIQVSSSMVGSYRYGLINWFRPIKVKAEFAPLSGGATYYTKPMVDSAIHSAGGGFSTEVIKISDPAVGPAELMTYQLNNGGSTFPFVTPFTITDEDVANEVNVKMDLVFNPANFGYAGTLGSTTCDLDQPHQTVCGESSGSAVEMSFPMLRMSPVPRKSGEKTYKEVYTVADYDTGLDLLVEIYYNDADTNKSPSGLEVTTLYKSGASTFNTSNKPYSYSVENLSDNTIVLKNYDGTESMRFKRRQTSPANATFTCMAGDTVCTGLSGGSNTFTRTITYNTTDTLVSSD